MDGAYSAAPSREVALLPDYASSLGVGSKSRQPTRSAMVVTLGVLLSVCALSVCFVFVTSGVSALASKSDHRHHATTSLNQFGEDSSDSFSSFVTYGKPCAQPMEKYWSDEGYNVDSDSLSGALHRLDRLVGKQLKEIDGAGLVLNVVYGDKVIWSNSYGYVTKEEPGRMPDQDTVFMLGSLSKIFPVLQLLLMRRDGLISLDDEVSKLFPEFTYVNPFSVHSKSKRARGITWRMLASELSGLPREAPDPCSIVCDMATEDVLALLRDTPLVVPPNTVPSYSNVGYSLIGRLLERVTGMSFEDYMQVNVFEPLGMASSGFVITPEIEKRLATGYANGKPVANKDVLWNRPTGAMFSTARDLSRFMSFMVTLDEEGVLLDHDSVREFALPQYMNGDGRSGFGMPWEMVRMDDELIRFKGGYVASSRFQIGGFRTGVAFIPDMKLAVVAVANSGGGDATTFTSLAMKELIEPVRALQAKQYRDEFRISGEYKGILGQYIDSKTQQPTFKVTEDNEGHLVYQQLDYHANYIAQVTAKSDHQVTLRLHPVSDGLTCLNMQVLAMQGPALVITTRQHEVEGSLPDTAPGMKYIRLE